MVATFMTLYKDMEELKLVIAVYRHRQFEKVVARNKFYFYGQMSGKGR